MVSANAEKLATMVLICICKYSPNFIFKNYKLFFAYIIKIKNGPSEQTIR